MKNLAPPIMSFFAGQSLSRFDAGNAGDGLPAFISARVVVAPHHLVPQHLTDEFGNGSVLVRRLAPRPARDFFFHRDGHVFQHEVSASARESLLSKATSRLSWL